MTNDKKVICPLCNDSVDRLLYRYHIDSEQKVIEKIKAENPAWTVGDGTCSRCVDYYHSHVVQQQLLLPAIGPYFPVKSMDDFIVLPTGLRVNAHPKYTGKGVVICIIDSGFSPHPDLTFHRNRIKAFVDVTGTDTELNTQPAENKWHGTMVSVVCACDGFLSGGLYKGIANDAELVLVKVQGNNAGIAPENIAKGLQWVLQHHRQYNIRVVNISLGGGTTPSFTESEIDTLAEALILQGVVVVAASGNDEHGQVQAPANAPNVIAVGGVNDENTLDAGGIKAYHSSYGLTPDNFMKPEVVAHAMWIAAPLQPGTNEWFEAASLQTLKNAEDCDLVSILQQQIGQTSLDISLLAEKELHFIRAAIASRLSEAKYISAGYVHVDGTSFAAPIVTAVVAQILEANPGLQPVHVREILFSTAKRIDTILPERQGFGIVQPRQALLKALKKEPKTKEYPSPFINRQNNTIRFCITDHSACQISLAGSFNGWQKDVLFFEPGTNGNWIIDIPLLMAGKYDYKFCLDSKYWIEDVDNPYRLPDGFNGFNSLLIIEN